MAQLASSPIISQPNETETPTEEEIPPEVTIVTSPGAGIYSTGYTGGAHQVSYMRACAQSCSFTEWEVYQACKNSEGFDEATQNCPANPVKVCGLSVLPDGVDGCDIIQYLQIGKTKSFPLTLNSDHCRDAYGSSGERACTKVEIAQMDERDYFLREAIARKFKDPSLITTREAIANTGAVYYQMSLSSKAGQFEKITNLKPSSGPFGNLMLESADHCNVVVPNIFSSGAIGALSITDRASPNTSRCFPAKNAAGKTYLNVRLVDPQELSEEFKNSTMGGTYGLSKCYDSTVNGSPNNLGCSFVFEMRN